MTPRDDSNSVELSPTTAATLERIRQWDVADSVIAQLDHVRCNVLMRKGLVVNLRPGKWAVTPLGRHVTIKVKRGRRDR